MTLEELIYTRLVQEKELAEKSARLTELDTLLHINEAGSEQLAG